MNSGIYQIVNTVNGKQYVGSAKHFEKRWRIHKTALRCGKHHSKHLQSAWNKYGADAFDFRILMLCEIDKLIENEQAYFGELKPEYNVAPYAGNTLGTRRSDATKAILSAKASGRKYPPEVVEQRAAKLRGKKMPPERIAHLFGNQFAKGVVYSEDRRATISHFMTGQKRPKSEEHRAKISAALKGKPLSEETKAKISAASKGKKRGAYQPWSEEAKQRFRDAMKSRPNPHVGAKRGHEALVNIAAGQRGRKHSPEQCAKKSAQANAMWADPERRALILAAQATARAARPTTVKKPVDRKPPDGGWKMPEAARQRMSDAKRGKPMSEAHKAAIRCGHEERKKRLTAEWLPPN